ncbi:geranylgeranyl reductase family protein [Cryptosporangium phraense]|nr:geranylgeranyl reductase family protein [Cryptosporangium phraense]
MTFGASAYDVAVIGAGPAGATAARVAAEAGCRVVLLERGVLPRYKTCGGGLIGLSRAALPPGFDVPARDSIDRFTFTLGGRLSRTWRTGAPIIDLVYRDELDARLTASALDAGAKLEEGVTVNGIERTPDGATMRLRTSAGEVAAKAVVGADGTSGRSGSYVGVTLDQVDLGLETEFAWPDPTAGDWKGRILIDWGPLPGSYGWVFPKGDALTVGVIAARGDGAATREYLAAFIDRLGLTGTPELRSSGHLTRCRAEDSPLFRDRVLVAGDAAGLLEPWTREGISYALRSGALAGASAVRVAGAVSESKLGFATAGYRAAIETVLGPEMRAGRAFHTAFSRRAAWFHTAIATAPPAWNVFRRFVTGDTTLARLASHRSVALTLKALSGGHG